MMDGMPMVDFSSYVASNSYCDVVSKSAKSTMLSTGGIDNVFSNSADNMMYGDSQVETLVKEGMCAIDNIQIFSML
jgi:hypothetical protein